MNPAGQDPNDFNPIADQNTERLLAGAYRPETPDPAFLARVTAAMQAEAARRANPARPATRSRYRLALKRWFGWAAAAGLLLVVGIVAGAIFLARPGYQRKEGTVWIDGKAFVEADVAVKDRLKAEQRAVGVPPLGGPLAALAVPPLGGIQQSAAGTAAPQGAGLVARPQPASAAAESLQVGQSLQTHGDQRRRLGLADGSILYLNRDTAVTLTAPREVTLRRGEIYVEVAQDPAAARFIIHTPQRQMIALGTKFDVRVAAQGTQLLVAQGKVQVSDVPLPVLAGQQLTLSGDKAASPDLSAAPRTTHTIEWTRDLMAAARSPLVPGSKYAGGSLVAVDPNGQEARLSLRKYLVDVYIEDGFARTTIDQTYFNQETSRLEGTFYFPLPPDASLSRLAMYVNGRLMEGGMAERQQARQVFDSIVYRMKDPALLEWVDGSTFKMRVFPLEGRQEKRIILSYTQRLPSLYGQSEYRFPGGHSLPLVGDWSVHVRVKQGAGRAEQGVECEPQLTVTKVDGDLLLDAAAKDVRPDRDVVLRLISNFKFQISNPKTRKVGPASGASAGPPLKTAGGPALASSLVPPYGSPLPAPCSLLPAPCFSSAVSDGSKYLMLRWQPDLPGETKRQRRDWIFLFESSGDRDPLLARTQIEIIKTILDNAEHDDTFSILTAATRVQAYRSQPQAATPANVKQAISFLEDVHLLGALDLGRAFAAARPLAVAAENPVLVHVGSGLPVLGLRDLEALVQLLPERAAYVGIGVGNRWSRALMKSAAAGHHVRMVGGGYFTQINPDEPIAWRALDLLATLNTPRLLDVRVSGRVGPDRVASAGPPSRIVGGPALASSLVPPYNFLACQDSLAQGEQLCAIARLDAAAELPKTVEITGQLGGKPQKWTLPVAGVAEQAHYLPRTWAKLEIDRLVADGAEKNKTRIIELSKAMYVMSPFTSLLVLENEQMYAQYHVDRGRKDHWAMYACPERIPVVNEPLVGPSAPSGKSEAHGPTAEEVLSTVLVRVPTSLLGRSGERPHHGVFTVPVAPVSWEWDVDNDGDGVPSSVWSNLGLPVSYIRDGQPDKPLFAILCLDPDLHKVNQLMDRFDSLMPEARRRLADEAGATAMGLLPFLSAGSTSRRPLFMAPSDMTAADLDGLRTDMRTDVADRMATQDAVNAAMAWLSKHQRADGKWRGNQNSDGGWRYYPYTDSSVTSARLAARFRDADDEMAAIRVARQKGFVDTLFDVEKQYIPTPDDPPIVYPDAEFWRKVTERRHEICGWTKVYPVSDLVLPIMAHDDPPIVYPDAEIWKKITHDRREMYSSEEFSRRTPADQKIEQALKDPTTIDFVETPLRDVVDYLKDLHHIEIQLDSAALKEAGIDENAPITKHLNGISLRSALKLMLDELQLTYVIHNEVLLITTPDKADTEEFLGYRPDSADMLLWILPGSNRQVPTYQPPVFSNSRAVFYDLLSYAPAMRTNLADVLAVLKAEARGTGILPVSNSTGWKPVPPGKIDDRARRLIERARGAGWQTATIADGKTPLTVAFDGTGRYRYQRTTSAGLREQVICDGTSLWHLYPELGIGARRTLSRFHRRDLQRLVPWALPPVEDLARGADLVSVDERTVAVVQHELEGPPEGGTTSARSPAFRRNPSSIRSSGDAEHVMPKERLRTLLVFAPEGRLAQRQLVEMPSGTIRFRESYGADGTVEFTATEKADAGGTPPPKRKIWLAPCGAPELKPGADLVVLPLPLRSRQQVLASRKLLGNETDGSWSEEDALAVIAADLGDAPAEMRQIIGQRFFRRGDRRLGFYTLLLSTGQTWNPKEKQPIQGGDPLLLDPLADHPHDPLAKYVAACLASVQPGGPKDFGDPGGTSLSLRRAWLSRPAGPKDFGDLAQAGSHDSGFFRQLAEFHDLWDRWHDGRAVAGDESQRLQERQRALAFIERAQPPEFGWGLLMAVRDSLNGRDFYDGFAAAIPRFETVPGLQYAARYESARALLNARNRSQARDLFAKLFTETLDAGLVPPIDGRFREALLQGHDSRLWPETIRAAAKKLIGAGARPSAVYLARQVQQVGDPTLAEEVFDMAFSNAPESQRLGLTLARIEYDRQTAQLPRADALLQPLLSDKRYGNSPALWYLAEAIADSRGMTARAIGLHQRAMEIEFEHLPEKVNVEVIRDDYGRLLSRYEKLATAMGPLGEAAPSDLLAGVIRAADHWRQLDPDPTAACQGAARVLGQLGETDLAWDYLTTPLAIQPNETAGLADLARTLRQQGLIDLADRAYAAASEADPANAQILWDRAESLRENGRPDQALPFFRQIAAGSWGPQFAGLQSRAKQYLP